MILRELLDSTNLSRAYVFYIYKVEKVVVIYKKKNFIFLTF